MRIKVFVDCETHHSSLLKKPLPPMLKMTVAVRHVMCLSSAVYTSAWTVYLPWWRNLLGQVDRLGNLHGASFDGAFEVDVADLLAEVRRGSKKPDETVLDFQQDIHPLDADDVVSMLAVTELQGTLPRDLEVLVGDDIAEDAQRRRRCQAGGQAGDGEPHRVDLETIQVLCRQGGLNRRLGGEGEDDGGTRRGAAISSSRMWWLGSAASWDQPRL
ncbi:Uncharacterized protein TCAP_01384 [Tolypocladium capitatum]|uniref:Uncharacterized protein n=1 Tax=Tolypocladium capitatum TaxID=45235 RepID=A0A2K3QMD4_9HYPO|nr:Uncharacterized protein TCAP_01384 [Tolypocladium capitatum]